MQFNKTLTSLPAAIVALTMFLVSVSGSAQAQGLLTYTTATWLPTITQPTVDILDSLTIVDSETACFELDPAAGEVEGFLFGTQTFFPPTISLFNGDTLVETLAINQMENVFDLDEGLFFYGWTNTEGIEITKIQLVNNPFSPELFFDRLDVSFLPVVVEPPAADTCFDQLADVKTGIEALLETATGNDVNRLECALDCLCWSQHDCFWEQPSGNRLTSYGSNVFLAGAYAICYLEGVSDAQADAIIDQYLDVLECLVDLEIEYAIANDGNQCYIDQAADYAELGDIIDDEFDNQVIASLAYRLAWLNAYYSTY